jgi:hypothetical protein
MRKLILDMELLAVESFEVSPMAHARTGTVAGHAAVDGGGAVVVGPGGDTTIEPFSRDCWTIQEECFITKDPRYYPCVCTYPVAETRDGGRTCAVEVYQTEAEVARY